MGGFFFHVAVVNLDHLLMYM